LTKLAAVQSYRHPYPQQQIGIAAAHGLHVPPITLVGRRVIGRGNIARSVRPAQPQLWGRGAFPKVVECSGTVRGGSGLPLSARKTPAPTSVHRELKTPRPAAPAS
jgi:hypothetical protein